MGGVGYAEFPGVGKICYDCCARMDAQSMVEQGQTVLYLTDRKIGEGDWKEWYVTNWPGTLEFRCIQSPNISKHNIAGIRRDVWFTGPDGYMWHGVAFGDNQLTRCKRMKKRRGECPVALDPAKYLKPYNYSR